MKKLFAYVIIPVCLFITGAVLAFYFYEEAYITVIQVHNENILPGNFTSSPLTRGMVFQSEVTASYNNLGAVQLRINTYDRINYNTIRFRLKEKGEENWLVSNKYVVDVFPNKLLYSFGFPVISDSAGKKYLFELTSDNGTPAQSIGFYGGYHEAATQYVFPVSSLMQDKKLLQMFVIEKVRSLAGDKYFVLYYGMFLIPTIVYFALLFLKSDRRIWLIELAAFGYMLYIFIFLPVAIQKDTMLYIFTIGVTVFLTYVFRVFYSTNTLPKYFSSQYLYILSVVLVGVLMLYIVLGKELEAERTAVGIYYITLSALMMMIRELSLKQKKT